MRSTPQQVYNEAPELLTVFDLLVPGALAPVREGSRLGTLREDGTYRTGRVALVVRPGGAQELAR